MPEWDNRQMYELQVYLNTPIGFNLYYSQDFCECVFKAIREVYA